MKRLRLDRYLTEDFRKSHRLAFVEEGEDRVWLDTDRPLSPMLRHLLHNLAGGAFRVRCLDPETFSARHRGGSVEYESLPGESGGEIVARVRAVVDRAIAQGASDIHVEPCDSGLRVRLRLDGQLSTLTRVDAASGEAFVSRLKVLGDLDIAEKRRPQDGKIKWSSGETDIHFRISTIPTCRGEKVVVRILDQTRLPLDLNILGMPAEVLDLFRAGIRRSHGLVLATGPTGSGKTTTLYAALKEIQSERLNITTVEDPIEYQIEGFNQVRIRPSIGFGFSQALRCFLRQDPNVIMVGEVRDGETAEIAVRASLTGHLVLSTLHTNNALAAPVRLCDMGVPAYLVGAALSLVVGQRLVRKLCGRCNVLDDRSERPSGQQVDGFKPNGPRLAVGCPHCGERGYAGRTGVFEALAVDRAVGAAISEGLDRDRLARLAPGFRPMFDHAKTLVEAGITSLEEVRREVFAQ